jgi:4-amino-4-deoxychorismate lyase
MKSSPKASVNGEISEHISISDRGLQYGDGVFETIAVHHGQPLLWQQHIARLLDGCERLGIGPAPDAESLRHHADELCADAQQAVLKVLVTRGESGRGYTIPAQCRPNRIVMLSSWPTYPREYADTGVDVRICDTRISRNPTLAGIKHLNRLEQVLAQSEWQSEYAEGLMLDEEGNIIEGTMTNLFLCSQGTLLTPDLSQSGVTGIMRAVVLDGAKEMSLPYEVTSITRELLDSAEEVFLTNSIIGIWPVRRIESIQYDVGDTTRRLQKEIKSSHCFGQAS